MNGIRVWILLISIIGMVSCMPTSDCKTVNNRERSFKLSFFFGDLNVILFLLKCIPVDGGKAIAIMRGLFKGSIVSGKSYFTRLTFLDFIFNLIYLLSL
jgi:hypothetical protein